MIESSKGEAPAIHEVMLPACTGFSVVLTLIFSALTKLSQRAAILAMQSPDLSASSYFCSFFLTCSRTPLQSADRTNKYSY